MWSVPGKAGDGWVDGLSRQAMRDGIGDVSDLDPTEHADDEVLAQKSHMPRVDTGTNGESEMSDLDVEHGVEPQQHCHLRGVVDHRAAEFQVGAVLLVVLLQNVVQVLELRRAVDGHLRLDALCLSQHRHSSLCLSNILSE